MNKVDICFHLMDIYRQRLKDAIALQGVISCDSIVDSFTKNNDLIFSLNRNYELGTTLKEFCTEHGLDPAIPQKLNLRGKLFLHQEKAMQSILQGTCTIVSTGTGSGKTESFFIPIFDYCLKNADKKGVKALIVYPMNALSNDQLRRFKRYTENTGVTVEVISGESEDKEQIILERPDILVTNYVMLDRLLVNKRYQNIWGREKTLQYIVLDELHSYNGNKALHIKYLLNRVKYLARPDVVQIGCSATLSRNRMGAKNDGYLIEKQLNDIDNFINCLFTTESNQFIEPVYASFVNNYISDDSSYNQLKDADMTNRIKQLLSDESKTLGELSKELSVSKSKLKAYFSQVLEVNKRHAENPVLDFRINLFFLEIGRVLKRCVGCGSYYTNNTSICPSCSELILPVSKKDPDLLLGKLSSVTESVLFDGKMIEYERPVIANPFLAEASSSSNPMELQDFTDKPRTYSDTIHFNTYVSNEHESLEITACEEGVYRVYFDESFNNYTVEDNIITLTKKNDMSFLSLLLKEILSSLEMDNRRIISFIDKREKCGRYSSVLNDEMMSSFFYEVVSFVNEEKYNLETLREHVKSQLATVLCDYDVQTQSILNDFEVWFLRSISTNLFLKKPFEFAIEEELEDETLRRLVEIGILEGAFVKEVRPLQPSSIQLGLFHAEKSRGLSLSSEYNAISLSNKGLKYAADVKSIGEFGIIEGLKKLSKKGIMIEVEMPDSDSVRLQEFGRYANVVFYLNPTKFSLKVPPSVYGSIYDIVENHLFYAGVHSSEIKKQEKTQVEEDFQSGKLQVLIATPTLEMGIDIGSLNYVFMLGVPPMPSNYAQRAGRAGRREDHFAGVVTICEESSNHDWYYFNHPKSIIEGTILSPKFNPRNIYVLNKHVNTYLLSRMNKSYPQTEEQIKSIFSRTTQVGTHEKLLDKLLENYGLHKNSPTNDLYHNGIFPDFVFRRDGVKLIDSQTKEEISVREPELAYRELVPETDMFIGAAYYRVSLPENAEMFESMDGRKVFLGTVFDCTRETGNIKPAKEIVKRETKVLIPKAGDKKFSKGPMSIYYYGNMPIELICSCSAGKKEEPMLFGYQLKKDSLVFEFDRNVMAEEQYISFIVALGKSIEYEYGLDESELGIILDEVTVCGESSFHSRYVILYDKTGSKNIEFKVILGNMEKLLEAALNSLLKCDCIPDCGCYLCLKSYTTQWYSQKIKKSEAIHFLRYLVGHVAFIPKFTTKEEIYAFEHILQLEQGKEGFSIRSDGNTRVLEDKGSQNETIMFELSSQLKLLQNHESIQIITNVDYIVNVINETGKIQNCLPLIQKFKFYKLAYNYVFGQKRGGTHV